MKAKQEIPTSNQIHFKSTEIENSLKKYGYYKKDKITIYQLLDFDQYLPKNEFIPPEEDYVFAFENKDEDIPFLGVVNFNFKRFGYCLNTYLNGDIYFGNYIQDIKSKKGFYSFKTKTEKDYKISQYYIGSWENNLFEGYGIYLWCKENKDIIPFNDFNNANFDAFIGNSEKGLFKKGVLLSYNKNNFFIYYGSLNSEGKREGNNCFYYSSNLDEMCYGSYNNNLFVEGFVGKFEKNSGKMNNLIIYKTNENKKPEGEKIKIGKEKNVEYTMSKFRNILFSKNYFQIIFEEFKKFLIFRDKKMKDINMINNNNKYEEIINFFDSNKITLLQDIEENVGE